MLIPIEGIVSFKLFTDQMDSYYPYLFLFFEAKSVLDQASIMPRSDIAISGLSKCNEDSYTKNVAALTGKDRTIIMENPRKKTASPWAW